jgi:acylphosphatase
MTSSQAESALRAFVRGRVQGVGFRAYVQRRAGELGLKGFARNLSDGATVEVVAEGERPALEALLAALRIGPSGASVERVDASWGEATGASSRFETR